ncbi:MAG: hypothetical protein GWN00_15065, partial [Aliifodinibius sp.]|nr:hypothetical protein [Fodinibius sp.]NIV12411.1 hypothetical protein [Fodinibius sp.]NIY26075.1 hypothetical protein [Fodinibius sp.]
YQEIENLEGVLSGRRAEKLQVSTDGQLLIVQQERTDFLRLIETNTHEFADSITIPVPQNKDMDIYDNMLYICSSGGFLYKYDLNNRSLVD